MELGWIDFSKSERSKVLDVLDLLGEKGVLDELGIATIREGFSNLFFPGITTIQTRAKYFVLSAYILKDLELSKDKDYNKLVNSLDNLEMECARIFLKNNPQENGVIGNRALKNNSWVQKTPINIYWTGLKKYNIFKDDRLSINEYLKLIVYQNKRNENINNNKEEFDDMDAGSLFNFHCLNIPIYNSKWKDNLQMDLTNKEANFLKDQIIESCPNSMLAFILKNDLREFLDFKSFNDIEQISYKFPDEIRTAFIKAKEFSDFVFVLNTFYYLIVSENKDKEAIDSYEMFKDDLVTISQIDIDYFFNYLKVKNPLLKNFLINAKSAMGENNIEELKDLIIKREIFLKGRSRAKTINSSNVDTSIGFSGKHLNYRFTQSRLIVEDIFKGCDADA